MNEPLDHQGAPAVNLLAHAQASIGAQQYCVRIRAGRHDLVADEPVALSGGDQGPAPFGLFLASLGACTSITLKMYAQKKGWPLEGLDVALEITRTSDGLQIDRRLTLHGDLQADQRARLADIVERTPVTLAIKAGVPITTIFSSPPSPSSPG